VRRPVGDRDSPPLQRLHRAEFRLLELIAELDAQRPWRHEAMPSCAHWLNMHCGIDLVTAREKVRIARALPDLPAIRGAFRDGELSYSKVRAITRIADRENETELVEMARSQTAAQVEREVKARRQAERLQESQAAFTAYRHRGFTCRYDETGSLVFEGRLPAEQGALLLTALDRPWSGCFRGSSIESRRRFGGPTRWRRSRSGFWVNRLRQMRDSTPPTGSR
jgi:Domain of unknown function (DUF222)